MAQVNWQHILRLKAELRAINKLELADIQWVDDQGNIMQPSKESIEEYRFTGLNVTDFPEIYQQEFSDEKS